MFFLFLGRAFGWLRSLPTIIVVYASTIQVNAFQEELFGNRCNRSLGLTLKAVNHPANFGGLQ